MSEKEPAWQAAADETCWTLECNSRLTSGQDSALARSLATEGNNAEDAIVFVAALALLLLNH